MSLVITEPIKTINGLLTKALAADTQLLYIIQRVDDAIISVLAGPSRVVVFGNLTANYSTGDRVSIGLDNRTDGGIYTVSSVVFNSPNTEIGSDLPDGSDDTGQINNLSTIENYRISIDIRDEADTFSILGTSFIYIPKQSGLLDLDISEIVSFYMRSVGLFSFSYFLRVTEVWEGSFESPIDTTILQAVLAQKQLLSVGGANMWENLLREYAEDETFSAIADVSGCRLAMNPTFTDSTNLYRIGEFIDVKFSGVLYTDGKYLVIAVSYISDITRVTIDLAFNGTDSGDVNTLEIPQLLTKFTTPLNWRGWNRTVSILVDSEFVNRNPNDILSVNNTNANVNKVLGASNGTSLTVNNPALNVYIAPVNKSDDFYNRVVCSTGGGTNKISQELFYRMENECNSAIMLDWINGLGGIDQWLFEVQQSVTLENDEGIVVERPITTDIEFINRTKRRFANTFRQQLTLKAEHLTLDQLLAIQEIKKTESLRVYLSKDGVQFIDAIVVNDFSSPYSTKDRHHKFTVIIELPDGFIFENGKLY